MNNPTAAILRTEMMTARTAWHLASGAARVDAFYRYEAARAACYAAERGPDGILPRSLDALAMESIRSGLNTAYVFDSYRKNAASMRRMADSIAKKTEKTGKPAKIGGYTVDMAEASAASSEVSAEDVSARMRDIIAETPSLRETYPMGDFQKNYVSTT